jgi:hypothetical protein
MRPILAPPTLAALTLIGLTAAAHPLTPQLFPEIALPGGAATLVPDTDVKLLVTKVEDGRCPAGTDCYWEGTIRVELTVSTKTAKQEIVLCNLCDDATDLASAAGWTWGLVDLAPTMEELAKLGRPPELTDYLVTVNWAKSQ